MGTFTIDQTQASKILWLIPNADGCNIDFIPNGAANNWECVDDPRISPDDDATYVSWQSFVIGYDLYSLPNHTTESGVINYVQIYARGKTDDSSFETEGVYKIILTENACSNIYKSNSFNLLVNNYILFNNLWLVNPRTAATWTWDDIDNLLIGVECSNPSTTSSVNSVFRPNADSAVACKKHPNADSNYDKVDETTPDDSATYVYSDYNDGWLQDLYGLPNHTTQVGTINYVTIFCRYQMYTAEGYNCVGHVKTLIKTHGTEYPGTSHDEQQSWPTSWKNISEIYINNPNTAAAWTWAEIDDLLAGAQLYCAGFLAANAQTRNTICYIVVNHTEAVDPEIRTTQCYAKVNYSEILQCIIQKPDEISVDHDRNTKMLNFWSGNRAVYDLARERKTMVLNGIFYGTDACEKVECVRDMGEYGSDITIAGLTGAEYNGVFKILSFGWKKIHDKPLTFRYILECEFSD